MKKNQTHQVRFTIDFPAEQHAYLKMVAAKKGITMKEYVIESLSKNCEKEDFIDLRQNKFKSALAKVLEEDHEILKRLSDK